MKKALFIIAAIATCMTANAKYWFSGSLGFETTSQYGTDEKGRVLELSPAFGMQIEDEIELGVELNIKDTKYFRNNSVNTQQMFSFGFAPFIRYTFFTEGNFNMFVQGGFEYAIVSPSGFNFWSLSLYAQPGIRYMMSDHFSVQAKFNGLAFTHMSNPEVGGYPGTTYKNNFGLNADFTALTFGLVYEF